MMAHLSSTPPPSSSGPAHQKQYVFVDEYNRSKRLKVMRACDGCRKRKIRCDGALQNGPWPCGACVRLKLNCVPPTLDQDDAESVSNSAPGQHSFSLQTPAFPTSAPSNTAAAAKPNGITSHPQTLTDWTTSAGPSVAVSTPSSATASHHDFDAAYSNQPYTAQLAPRLDAAAYSDDEYFASTTAPAQFQQSHQMPSLLRTDTTASSASSGDPQEIDATVRELSGQMGDLQIDITSAAPYVVNHQRNTVEGPAVEEASDVVLPASVYTDSTVRIPPEMMPSEERAMDYFGYYFDHIHSYCPVLNRAAFYDQWRNARSSIPPLILEGIFACVARYLEEPIEARRWLALASRHEETFKDVPRLSTIQAMIILMKAGESLSKRGYYYRSWMSVKYMTTMGFDLSLHEHNDQHRSGGSCAFSKVDCLVRTRIWQTLFQLEILVGSPLGRTDFSIEIDTVQLTLPLPSDDVDAFEHQTTRRSTFMAQAVRNIKLSSQLWISMRKYNKDWALDPSFVGHNEDLPLWLHNLPADMQIHYSDDGSPPWLGGEHYLASLHAYHHLTVIMHHRPQLQALLSRGDPNFKTALDICLSSAVQMCRLQEALYRDFGLHGLQFMTRGIGFTVYCVLTCAILHLAAITCPDPILNSQARTFFPRHMRVLEHCMPSSNPDMIVQINALREAFSQDTTKPFELKPTLGLRSPSPSSHATPPSTNSGPTSTSVHAPSTWSNFHDSSTSKAVTPGTDYSHSYDSVPPHETSVQSHIPYNTTSFDVPAQTSYASQSLPPLNTATHTGYALETTISNDSQTPVWDPSGIFNSWSHAFGGATASPQQPTPTDPRILQPTSAPIMPQHQSPAATQSMYSAQHQIPVDASPVDPTHPVVMPHVTPVMWQDAFTNAYVSGHGQKRYREASIDHSAYSAPPVSQYKRRG